MWFEDFFAINTYVCLPLTALVIILVLCLVKREQTPLIYYINLLISNLIQFISYILAIYVHNWIFHIIWIVVLMVGLYFRMIIAMERCFVITRPQWNWIRQTGKSLLVSVLVWILCITPVSLSLAFGQFVPVLVFALLPAPLFIFFLAWTIKALPAATSVPTDEKRRIVGTLILLFILYILMILYSITSLIAPHYFPDVLRYIFFVLFLLIPYMDLILAFFLRKGPIDKLLLCLCCCITDNTAEDVAGHQLHELMLQQQRERDEVNQTV